MKAAKLLLNLSDPTAQYLTKQLEKIGADDLIPGVQVVSVKFYSSNGQTNYLNISAETFKKVADIILEDC